MNTWRDERRRIKKKGKNAWRKYDKKELTQKGRKSKKRSGKSDIRLRRSFGKHSIQEQMNEWVVLLLHSVKPLRGLLSSHNTFYFGFMVSIFEASHSYKENVNCSLKQHKRLTLCIRGTQWYILIHSADLPSTVLRETSAYLVYWEERNCVSTLTFVKMSTEPLNKRLPVTTFLASIH
jgi:hypothetical protein